MNYKQLTIYNYKVSYYLIRIFAFVWLVLQYLIFQTDSQRPQLFYEPTVWLQKLFFPIFPNAIYFYSLLFICGILLLISLVKPSVVINVVCFFLIAIINLPIASYHGIGHNNHLLVLSFFLSLFLIPRKLEEKDYKYVQYFQLGLLITYSLSGLWKIISIAKDVITKDPNISWIESNAAKLNTYTNYHLVDQLPPEFITKIFAYSGLWTALTIFAILMQTFSFLGAFNRKFLTVVIIFLVIFHVYNIYFVIADFTVAIFVVIILFFPYHIFKFKNSSFNNIFEKQKLNL